MVGERDAARKRVLHALRNLTEYVNRPIGQPYNERILDYLSREVRKATEAYSKLLKETPGQSDEEKIA
jgi:hypothetical protein